VTAREASGQEQLILFDILETLGRSIKDVKLSERRAFLEVAYSSLGYSRHVKLAEQEAPSMAKVKAIWKRGGEGAIIKRLSSKYSPGWRSPDWIKIKAQLAATLEVIGYEEGKNGPYSVVKLRDSAGIETTVKTLDNQTMRTLAADPKAFIGKRLVISYQEKMPSGKYRHPVFDHWAGPGE
jgi:ATP-dependent DNA ligase